jgi:hypothetical protein
MGKNDVCKTCGFILAFVFMDDGETYCVECYGEKHGYAKSVTSARAKNGTTGDEK